MGMHLTYTHDGVSGEGYLALPESESGPAVIVIQEWWGLVSHITDVVDRFAAAGFVAFAPDLYHGQATSEPDTAMKLMMELQFDLAGEEITNATNYLTSLPETSTEHVGVVGFCMGGSLAIWSGTLSPKISATVGFYPGSRQISAPKWENYQGKFALIHCAESDGTSSAAGIQEALAEISKAGGAATAYDYAGTQHAFFNDDRPEVFDSLSASLAWERTLEFLFKALK